MSSGINGQFLLALILVLFGVVGVVRVSVPAARSLLAARWPSVDGSVVDVGVLTDREMRASWAYGISQLTTVSKPDIRYTYLVGDQTYTNDRLQFRSKSIHADSLRSAQRVADRYTKGEAVKVYVSPSDPSISVLEVGLHWTHVGRIAMACVPMIVGVVWMLMLTHGPITWL